MLLDGFDRDLFLREYWQRQPLLIRHAGTPFVDPIDADELAGLACEEEMESRLVTCSGDNWQLTHGPFTAKAFSRLPESHWTLLVQAVDQMVSEVDDLKRIVDFLPAWRIDDIMVSYACDGGGVGPHFDQYDVFLIQGQGSRRWQIGQSCNSDSPLRPDTGLSLLEHFEPVAEYLLEPGDILYVPPRVAHYGVSLGESLCYSVGFRAPSHAELIQEFSDLLIDSLTEDQRFTDPSFHSASDPGVISEPAINRAFKEVAGLVDNRSLLTDAFAGFVTRPRYPDRITAPDSAPDEQMTIEQLGISGFGSRLYKNPASRFACFPDGSRLRVYADGRRYDCSADLLPLVNRLSEAPWSQPLFPGGLPQSRAVAGLLCWLLAQGSLLEDSASDTPDHDD